MGNELALSVNEPRKGEVRLTDVANGAKSGSLDGGGGVHEKLNQATRNTGLNDGLDLVVTTIGEVCGGG